MQEGLVVERQGGCAQGEGDAGSEGETDGLSIPLHPSHLDRFRSKQPLHLLLVVGLGRQVQRTASSKFSIAVSGFVLYRRHHCPGAETALAFETLCTCVELTGEERGFAVLFSKSVATLYCDSRTVLCCVRAPTIVSGKGGGPK
eukprot:1715967-Rhodomonas_salina.1